MSRSQSRTQQKEHNLIIVVRSGLAGINLFVLGDGLAEGKGGPCNGGGKIKKGGPH